MSTNETRGGLSTSRQIVGGIPFIAVDPSVAVDTIIKQARESRTSGTPIHFANAYSIALATKDEAYRRVLSTNSMTFPDGKPISWISRFRRHKPALVQVPGPWFFEETMKRGRDVNIRHVLLGSTPEVLEQLTRTLEMKYPGVKIVGQISPPFRPMQIREQTEQDALIRSLEPDVVWVGLGTPKQDIEASRLAETLTAHVAAVGAAFDFSAGRVPRAPRWMSAAGLEWVHRLLLDPKRLWRRYLFGNARFLWSVLVKRI